jgi:hypothetical protein
VIDALASQCRGEQVDLKALISQEELEAYRMAAADLAADNSTKGLPVVVAQTIFAFSYAISYYQTFAAPLSPDSLGTIEIHSIGESADVAPCYITLTGISVFVGCYMGDTCDLFRITDRGFTNERCNAEDP